MTDLRYIENLAEAFLQSGSNHLRARAQAQILSLRDDQPNQFLLLFLTLLETSKSPPIRTFAAITLCKNLSVFTHNPYKYLWPELTPQLKQQLQLKLFSILRQETDPSVARQISSGIGELGASVGLNQWPHFTQSLWLLFSQAPIQGFHLLQSFLSFDTEQLLPQMSRLRELFQKALEHSDWTVQLAGLRALATHIEGAAFKQLAPYQDLAVPIYKTAYHLAQKGYQAGFETICQVVEQQPRFFKSTFESLHQLGVSAGQLQDTIQRLAIEILLRMADRYPDLYQPRPDRVGALVELIALHMIRMEEPSPNWLSPPDSYNEDQDDYLDYAHFGMDAISRLASKQDQCVLPQLLSIISTMLETNNWRLRFSAIMILSRLGQLIGKQSSRIVTALLQMVNDPNPLIRYACYRALGQLSQDLEQALVAPFGRQIYEQLLTGLKESVPCVLARAADALVNLLAYLRYDEVEASMGELMGLLLIHVASGLSIVREPAVTALGMAAYMAGARFSMYLQLTLQHLFRIIESEQSTSQNSLRGLCIQALTFIALAVGPELFRPALPPLVSFMVSVQSGELGIAERSYLLMGWERLCDALKKEMSPFMQVLLPSLFSLIDKVIVDSIDADLEDATAKAEQAEEAMKMLSVMMAELPADYIPFVDRTWRVLHHIIRVHPSELLKKQCWDCLPHLLRSAHLAGIEAVCTVAKQMLGSLLGILQKEFDASVICCSMKVLKRIVLEPNQPFLCSQDINQLCESIIKLFLGCEDRKRVNQAIFDAQDSTDEDLNIEQEIEDEEKTQLAIGQFVGALFKTHPLLSLGVAEFFISNVLPKSLGSSDLMNRFGVCLISDMAEYLCFELLPKDWGSFLVPLLENSRHENLQIRQAACYGLGVYIHRSPTSVAQPNLKTVMNTLQQAATIRENCEQVKERRFAEKIATAIGKIVKAHGGVFDAKPILKIWLGMLPLCQDRDATSQHQLLADIMLNNPALLLSNSQEDVLIVRKVIGVYASILDTKTCNLSTKHKIKASLSLLQSNQFFITNMAAICGSLTDTQRSKLLALAN